MVALRKDVTDRGTDTRQAFKRLIGAGSIENGELQLPEDAPDPTNHALAYYQWVAGADADDLRAKWEDAREMVWQYRQGWEETFDLDDMEVQGLQTVTFGWMLMRAFARDHGVDLSALPQEEALNSALRHIAGEIGPEGQRKSHMDRFVELFERAAAAGYVERAQHFEVVHEGKGEEQLRIHLGRAYDALSKYARDHGLDSEELLSNAGDYRKRFKEAAESDGSYVSTHSQKTPGLGRCVGVNTIIAMNQLDFDRRTLGLVLTGEEGINADAATSTTAQAAADGDDEIEGDGQRIDEHLRTSYDDGDMVNAPTLADELGVEPETVATRLDRLAQREGVVTQVGANQYRVLK